MTIIDASNLDHREINDKIRETGEEMTIRGCLGQRFIATGASDKKIAIEGVPGNALGSYLNGATIDVRGNAQDAVGDTMNDGTIIVRGDVRDVAGYAARGGRIYVRGNAGYRVGVHMKAYEDKSPLIVVGGRAGSFLGEYQAGGSIVVLGLGIGDKPLVGDFPCAGMHGGKMWLRCAPDRVRFPNQVLARRIEESERAELRALIADYCRVFDLDLDETTSGAFTVVVPNASNPYRQLRVDN